MSSKVERNKREKRPEKMDPSNQENKMTEGSTDLSAEQYMQKHSNPFTRKYYRSRKILSNIFAGGFRGLMLIDKR